MQTRARLSTIVAVCILATTMAAALLVTGCSGGSQSSNQSSDQSASSAASSSAANQAIAGIVKTAYADEVNPAENEIEGWWQVIGQSGSVIHNFTNGYDVIYMRNEENPDEFKFSSKEKLKSVKTFTSDEFSDINEPGIVLTLENDSTYYLLDSDKRTLQSRDAQGSIGSYSGSSSLAKLDSAPEQLIPYEEEPANSASATAISPDEKTTETPTETTTENSAETEELAAYRVLLSSFIELYGQPEIKTISDSRYSGAQYISGLAYAELVSFRPDATALVVSYYDPSKDEDPECPGGGIECYPVQVWQYNGAQKTVKLVHTGIAQLEGQENYCAALRLCSDASGEQARLLETQVDDYQSPIWTDRYYGFDDAGNFTTLPEWRCKIYRDKNGKFVTEFERDGNPASEDEYKAEVDKLENRSWYLSRLADSDDRNIEETMATVQKTKQALGFE